MKTVCIKTYGCQMNERDSEALAALLGQRGYALTDSETAADVILLNTCSVRDLAEQKALGKMARLGDLKRRRPSLVLGFLGCMAQSRGHSLVDSQPALDLVVGTQRFHHLPDYLDRIFQSRGAEAAEYDAQLQAQARAPLVDVAEESGSESAVCDHLPFSPLERPAAAFVSIMQGCDMHCSFCIVPYTRGHERSRPIPEIVAEVEQLVGQGVKEVTLLGQIVTSYGRQTMPKKNGRSPFVQLLEAVHEVNGLARLRFTSPHPKGFGDDLVAAFRDLPKLGEHAHLPVQSGSDRILKLMNRGYSRRWYLDLVRNLRQAQPGLALTTDIIVGFPGETDADFDETAALMEEVQFGQAYLFKYSIRRGTPAASLPEPVSEPVKEQRHQRLLQLLNAGMLRRHQQMIGQTVEVLVEGRSTRNPRRLFGRTRANQGVVFEGDDAQRGQLLRLRLERATTTTLYGQLDGKGA